ncbi:SdpI family protein [Haloarchaeobius sp. DT45]|uniref:SdpI family protein n=1 Tax=Haloarchaeobius sp. DT45 TaxID=3446116 RepID=UPI003F6BF7E2
MKTSHRFTLAAGFVVAAGVASVLAAPSLPDQLATHWNAAGEPDGSMSKPLALALIPVLSAALLVLFALLPRIDPLRENVEAFRPYYDWFVVVFAAYMSVLHVGIVAFNLGYEFDFTLLVLAALAGLFYYVGILLDHAERNWFVGIRTPWTLTNEEVWRRTHDLASRLFKLAALVSLVGLLFGEYALYFLLVPVLSTAVVTIAYSYYLYQKLDGGDVASTESGL